MFVEPRIDRSALVIQDLHDEPDDRRYGWRGTPLERLAALENLP